MGLKPKATPEEVVNFIEAVYPGNADLAMVFFSEKKCLKDATEIILTLRYQLATLKAKMREIDDALDSGAPLKLFARDVQSILCLPDVREILKEK